MERGSGCCEHHCSLTDFEGLRNIKHKTPPRWRNKGNPFSPLLTNPCPTPHPTREISEHPGSGPRKGWWSQGWAVGGQGGRLPDSLSPTFPVPAQKGPRDSGNTSLTGAKLSVARPCRFAHAPSHTALPESAQRRIQWGPPSWKPCWGPADLVLPGCCPLPTCGGLFPPPCPWGSTSRRRKPPGGFPSSAVRGKVFFFPVHHGRCFENYSQKKLLKKENQKAYKTDSTLLLVISTDIKLLCQFSPNISKCLLSIFVLSPHMGTTIWGPARPSDVSGRGAQGGFSSPRVASCPSASPAHPLLGPPGPSWIT